MKYVNFKVIKRLADAIAKHLNFDDNEYHHWISDPEKS